MASLLFEKTGQDAGPCTARGARCGGNAGWQGLVQQRGVEAVGGTGHRLLLPDRLPASTKRCRHTRAGLRSRRRDGDPQQGDLILEGRPGRHLAALLWHVLGGPQGQPCRAEGREAASDAVCDVGGCEAQTEQRRRRCCGSDSSGWPGQARSQIWGKARVCQSPLSPNPSSAGTVTRRRPPAAAAAATAPAKERRRARGIVMGFLPQVQTGENEWQTTLVCDRAPNVACGPRACRLWVGRRLVHTLPLPSISLHCIVRNARTGSRDSSAHDTPKARSARAHHAG